MQRFLAVALAAALSSGAGVALAQPQQGPSTPPHAAAAPAKPATAPRAHHARAANVNPDTKALNLLEANGYTDIQQFRQIGQQYEAVATQNGNLVTVVVDPATGQVHNRGA